MNNKFENIEDLIAKFLAGEANADEIALLEEWRNLSVENAREFSQFEKLFGESAKLGDVINVDTDAAWENVREAIHSPSKGRIVRLKGSKQIPVLLRIAAILLLVAGIGIIAWFMAGRNETQFVEVTATDSVKVVNLPDGSHLALNHNSTVSYSINPDSKKRIVRLTGEAYFEVKHDSLSPFVVETGGLEITDIGTAFNVNARKGSDRIIITVVEGEVQLSASSGNTVFISAGEEAIYDAITKNIEMSDQIDKNISAYKDKIFIFENAYLSDVVKVLSEVYDVNLAMSSDNLKDCRITVSFNDEQIDVIAEVIAETLGLTLTKEPGKIIFSGDVCK